MREITNQRILVLGTHTSPLHASLVHGYAFGETIHLLPPNKKDREDILASQIPDNVSSGHIQMHLIASQTEGYLPADLRVLVERGNTKVKLMISYSTGSNALGERKSTRI
jgi:hypothetical protein